MSAAGELRWLQCQECTLRTAQESFAMPFAHEKRQDSSKLQQEKVREGVEAWELCPSSEAAENRLYDILFLFAAKNKNMVVIHSFKGEGASAQKTAGRQTTSFELDLLVIDRMYGLIIFEVKGGTSGAEAAHNGVREKRTNLENIKRPRVKEMLQVHATQGLQGCSPESLLFKKSFVCLPNCKRTQGLSFACKCTPINHAKDLESCLYMDDMNSLDVFEHWWGKNVTSAKHDSSDANILSKEQYVFLLQVFFINSHLSRWVNVECTTNELNLLWNKCVSECSSDIIEEINQTKVEDELQKIAQSQSVSKEDKVQGRKGKQHSSAAGKTNVQHDLINVSSSRTSWSYFLTREQINTLNVKNARVAWIIGGPGTGKTTVVLEGIARILNEELETTCLVSFCTERLKEFVQQEMRKQFPDDELLRRVEIVSITDMLNDWLTGMWSNGQILRVHETNGTLIIYEADVTLLFYSFVIVHILKKLASEGLPATTSLANASKDYAELSCNLFRDFVNSYNGQLAHNCFNRKLVPIHFGPTSRESQILNNKDLFYIRRQSTAVSVAKDKNEDLTSIFRSISVNTTSQTTASSYIYKPVADDIQRLMENLKTCRQYDYVFIDEAEDLKKGNIGLWKEIAMLLSLKRLVICVDQFQDADLITPFTVHINKLAPPASENNIVINNLTKVLRCTKPIYNIMSKHVFNQAHGPDPTANYLLQQMPIPTLNLKYLVDDCVPNGVPVTFFRFMNAAATVVNEQDEKTFFAAGIHECLNRLLKMCGPRWCANASLTVIMHSRAQNFSKSDTNWLEQELSHQKQAFRSFSFADNPRKFKGLEADVILYYAPCAPFFTEVWNYTYMVCQQLDENFVFSEDDPLFLSRCVEFWRLYLIQYNALRFLAISRAKSLLVIAATAENIERLSRESDIYIPADGISDKLRNNITQRFKGAVNYAQSAIADYQANLPVNYT